MASTFEASKRDEGPGALASRLQAALALDHPFQGRGFLRDGAVTAASVAVLFSRDPDPGILLTLRTEQVEAHKGQIAFPGGVRDPEDDDFVATALRETEEEVGIPRSQIEVVGLMPPLWTSTGFEVTPVVGTLSESMRELAMLPNPAEIAEIFWAPLSLLQGGSAYRRESLKVGDFSHPIHVFQVGRHRVWGVTGAILKNLLDRLGQLK